MLRARRIPKPPRTRPAVSDRVRLNSRSPYREGRGRVGTVVLVYGWGTFTYAVVDMDALGEVTCRARELDPAPDGVWEAP